MVRPKKHLGQHFLTDRNIASQIAGSLKAAGASCILEIGPGKGVLTQFLMQRNDVPLKLIEIDRESVVYLKENWPQLEKDIKEGDFLQEDLNGYGNRLAIIGNFPYNISSQIFFRILDYRESVPEVVCMIQKEVAERIASPPGSKKYGILSVFLQTWYTIDILFHVNPGAFLPPPKV
jgi:16S rRNA (adenine1518-N6/adenine1519-N6)-dimethyltransferase